MSKLSGEHKKLALRVAECIAKHWPHKEAVPYDIAVFVNTTATYEFMTAINDAVQDEMMESDKEWAAKMTDTKLRFVEKGGRWVVTVLIGNNVNEIKGFSTSAVFADATFLANRNFQTDVVVPLREMHIEVNQ